MIHVPKCQTRHGFIGTGTPNEYIVQNVEGDRAKRLLNQFSGEPVGSDSVVPNENAVEPPSPLNEITVETESGVIVAVALDDNWYMGRVEGSGTNGACKISFMCREGKKWNLSQRQYLCIRIMCCAMWM